MWRRSATQPISVSNQTLYIIPCYLCVLCALRADVCQAARAHTYWILLRLTIICHISHPVRATRRCRLSVLCDMCTRCSRYVCAERAVSRESHNLCQLENRVSQKWGRLWAGLAVRYYGQGFLVLVLKIFLDVLLSFNIYC